MNPAKSLKNSSFQGIENFLHEPSRLQIMKYLSSVESIDMIYLKNNLSLSWGNLSSHVSKLEEKGYIMVEKKFIKKKPYTLLQISPFGQNQFSKYLKNIHQFLFE